MREEIEFDDEYELQQLTNNNLEIFGLKFVAAEFQCKKQRVDGLAVNITSDDKEKKSFVIIEYKNRKNNKVLDQGRRYYTNLQENKERYIKKYNDTFKTELTKNDFDFSKTKVMIIAPEFYKSQKNNEEENIELWEVSLYDDGKVTYEKIGEEEIKKELKIDFEEFEEFLEDKTLNKIPKENQEIYCSFRDKVLENPNYKLKRVYINKGVSFRVNKKIACILHFRKNVKIRYYTDKQIDSENKATYKPKKKNRPAYYELTLKTKDETDYALDLLEKVYLEKRGDGND